MKISKKSRVFSLLVSIFGLVGASQAQNYRCDVVNDSPEYPLSTMTLSFLPQSGRPFRHQTKPGSSQNVSYEMEFTNCVSTSWPLTANVEAGD